MHILWLLEPVEVPKDQYYFKITATFKLLEPVKKGACEEFVISYNFEKNSMDQKMWAFFILEPARLLGACKPGSRARMDSTIGLSFEASLTGQRGEIVRLYWRQSPISPVSQSGTSSQFGH